ncbi:MAG: putative quinol monooxygenase [Oscillospiraceae bacterium]|nr:putative quinol monooxygenase [Oscillospiraceae bacterium]MDD4368364.1 putative quinol monooxygenase [Oscillospiraceae bacterium]
MIKLVADNYIRADKLEEFLTLARQLVQETRAHDAGCIRYELLQDVNDPLHLTMLEEWADQEALAKHSQSVHFKAAVPQFALLASRTGETHLFQQLA